jgi:hypothetical protein
MVTIMENKNQNLIDSNDAKRMNLAQWRASRLHELTLPSGLSATVRDVTMTDLLLTGKLPASFVEMADEAAKSGAAGLDLKQLAQNGAEFKTMLDALVTLALVSPELATAADDEHITLDEFPNDDKMAIFNFVNREVTALQSFRDGQNKPVAVV